FPFSTLRPPPTPTPFPYTTLFRSHAAPPGLQASRVLVDAPCSGLGVLRRNPEARWRLTAQEVDAFPARQLTLLESYAPLTAPGRSEEHTSELQSLTNLVCRLLLAK